MSLEYEYWLNKARTLRELEPPKCIRCRDDLRRNDGFTHLGDCMTDDFPREGSDHSHIPSGSDIEPRSNQEALVRGRYLGHPGLALDG